jgi:hypothetical protein
LTFVGGANGEFPRIVTEIWLITCGCGNIR